jgi:hypothetical protein
MPLLVFQSSNTILPSLSRLGASMVPPNMCCSLTSWTSGSKMVKPSPSHQRLEVAEGYGGAFNVGA